MKEIVFQAEKRDLIGKQVKILRNDGKLPAVLYGKSIDPIPVSVDYRDASKVIPRITSSQLVVIDVDDQKYHALVREKQRDPVMANLLHVDFMVVSMTERLRATVTIELIGESPAVRDLSAVLVSGLDVLEVECLAKDLPDRIAVDISPLVEIGDTLYVRDLELKGEIDILTDLEEMLATVTYMAAEIKEDEEEIVEEVEAEPEVIERGKKEEEEEEEQEQEES